MATSNVVSQVNWSDNRSELRVKGTVGGVAFVTTLRNFYFDPIAGGASQLASRLMSRYNAIAAAITAKLANATVNIPILDNKTSAIVMGATPVTFVGHNTLEITGTVDTVSTVTQIDQDIFLEIYNAQGSGGVDLGVFVARKLWEQAQFNALLTAAGIIATIIL